MKNWSHWILLFYYTFTYGKEHFSWPQYSTCVNNYTCIHANSKLYSLIARKCLKLVKVKHFHSNHPWMFSSLVRLKDATIFFQARPLLSHALDTEEFDSLADPRLEKNYVESELYCMIEVAAACVRHSAAKRPRMGQVNSGYCKNGKMFFLIIN